MSEEIEETAQTEEENIERNHKKAKKLQRLKDESSVTFFLHAVLFMFFTTAFTFLLFLHKNRYPLVLNDEILPEVLFSCVGLLIFSMVSLFLLSFWKFLGRVFLAVVTGACAAYVLGVLYPENIGAYVGGWLPFLPNAQLRWLAENGNLCFGVAVGAVLFVFLNIFKGAAMAFLSLPVLGALFILLNLSSKQVSPSIVQQNALLSSDEDNGKTQNLIYLILADHTGYKASVEDWKAAFPQSKDPLGEANSPAFVNAFYRSNGFSFYPSAYMRYADRYRNVGSVLNPSQEDISASMFSRDDASYYTASDDARVIPLKNELFGALKDKGYKINVYQTFPFDFCKTAGGTVERCVTYPAPTGALYQTDLSTANRVMLLVGHFLDSMPLGKKLIADLRAKTQMSDMPFVGNPLSRSLPIGQAGVLYRLTKDVETAKGKNVFFAHLDLPHYPYMYDENCRLEADPENWRSRQSVFPKKDVLDTQKNRQAYMRQLACTYGQLNFMLKDLKSSGALKNTKIVIHGDRGDGLRKDDRFLSGLTRIQLQIEKIKRDMATVFAVYDPEKSKASVEKDACDIGTLVGKTVLGAEGRACLPPDLGTQTDQEKDEVAKWLSEPVDPAALKKESYAPVYAAWSEKGGQAFMARVAQRQQQADKSLANADKMLFVAPPLENAAKPAAPDEAKAAPDFVPVPAEHAVDARNEGGFEVLDDEFADLPQPIEIPETSAEDKWKTLDAPQAAEPKIGESIPELSFDDVPPPASEPQPVPAPEPQPEPAALPAVPEPVSQTDELPAETLDLPALDFAEPSLNDLEQAASVENAKAEMQAKLDAEAKAKAEEEERLRKEAEEQARAAEQAEKQAREQAEAALAAEEARRAAEEQARKDAEEQAKKEAEMRQRIEAEIRAKLDAEAKAKTEAEARIKAEIEAKLKAEAEAKARREAEEAKEKAEQAARIQKAIDDANAKQKAAEEARLREEAEAAAKKAFPPALEIDENADKTREVITERTNQYGETETYIFIERQPNPNRNVPKKREMEIKQELIRVEPKTTDLEAKSPEPQKQTAEQPAERVLGTESDDGAQDKDTDVSALQKQTEKAAAVESAEAVENAVPAERAVPEPEGRELTD